MQQSNEYRQQQQQQYKQQFNSIEFIAQAWLVFGVLVKSKNLQWQAQRNIRGRCVADSAAVAV